MMRFILPLSLLLFFTELTHAGAGAHGGDAVKSRFIWGKVIAKQILKSEQCKITFQSEKVCNLMWNKLHQSGWDWQPKLPLVVTLDKQKVEVTLRIHEKEGSDIEVDLVKASQMKLSPLEVVSLMVHEAGHAVVVSNSLTGSTTLSDHLVTDSLVSEVIAADYSLQILLILAMDVPTLDMDIEKGLGREDQSYRLAIHALGQSMNLGAGPIDIVKEKEAYLLAIESIQNMIGSDKNNYLKIVLMSAKLDMYAFKNFENKIKIKKQVSMLRIYVQSIYEDLKILKHLREDKESSIDLTNYLKNQINNLLLKGISVSTYLEEKLLYIRGIERILLFSTETRIKKNDDILNYEKVLKESIKHIATHPNLGIKEQVRYLRYALKTGR